MSLFKSLHLKHVGTYIHLCFLILTCRFVHQSANATFPWSPKCKALWGPVIAFIIHFSPHIDECHLCARYWGMQMMRRPYGLWSLHFSPSSPLAVFSLCLLYSSYMTLLLVLGKPIHSHASHIQFSLSGILLHTPTLHPSNPYSVIFLA